jgi:hypothetical protein
MPRFHLPVVLLAAAHAIVLPSPSCLMGDGIDGLTCPVPATSPASAPLPGTWVIDYSLRNSTACMPEYSGGALNNISFIPAPGHHWGLASLDWEVGRGTWLNPSDVNASTCEATSIANCRALKASGALTRCSIYHNVELALQWLESNRAVMYDATKSDWFLQYTDGNGHKNGTIYNAHRAEGDQFVSHLEAPTHAARDPHPAPIASPPFSLLTTVMPTPPPTLRAPSSRSSWTTTST